MVVLDRGADTANVRILARGNFSLSGRGLVGSITLLGVVTLALASTLAWLGYWPILLIAVVQLALVAWVLIRAWYAAWIVERVEIDADRIRVVRMQQSGQHSWNLEARWARIWLEPAAVRWYAPRLIVRSKGESVELGAFLSEAEKRELAAHLGQALAPHSAWREQTVKP